MKNKRVLCIGGTSGMGRGIAEAVKSQGAEVIITSRALDKAVEAASEFGAQGLAVDITDASSVEVLFKTVGSFDHLAITSGASGRSRFSDTPPDQARAFMEAKLWATHQCLWSAKPYLRGDGSITLISGGYAEAVTNEAGHVHIAFQAVEAMARAAAVAFAPVRCNVVRPGFIDSAFWDFLDAGARDTLREQEKSRTLVGRSISAREFGDAVAAIMAASAITGATIPIDGGRHLWQPA